MDSLRRVWVRCMRRAMHPFPLLMGPPGRGCVCVCECFFFFLCKRKRKKKEVGTHFMRQSQRKTSFLRGSSLDFVRVDGGKRNRISCVPSVNAGRSRFCSLIKAFLEETLYMFILQIWSEDQTKQLCSTLRALISP